MDDNKHIYMILALVACLLALPAGGALAQDYEEEFQTEENNFVPETRTEGKFRFGVRGGINANSFDNIQSVQIMPFNLDGLVDLGDNIDLTTIFFLQPADGVDIAYHGGIYLRYEFTPAFGLQMDFLYNEQGGVRQLQSIVTGGIKQGRVKMHNVEVPLLASIRVFEGDLTSGHVIAGGAAAYNLFSSQNFTQITADNQFGVLTLVDGSFENVTSQYRQFQFGAYLGTRFDTEVGDLQLSMDIRYRFGIERVNTLGRIYDQFDARANTLSVSLGIGI